MNKKDLIGKNDFYLVVADNGEYLKTSFYDDFENVSGWGNIVFSSQIKNNDWLHFQVGSSWLKKKISQLHIAKPQSETWWFDLEVLDLKNGSHIKKAKIGGNETPVTYETL
jgi:hypothetical protein